MPRTSSQGLTLAPLFVLGLAACGDSTSPEDSGLPQRDAGFIDLTDASVRDLGTADARVDAGSTPDTGADLDAESTPDLGEGDAGAPPDVGGPPDLGPANQTGELVITEIRMAGAGPDWLEVENVSGAAIELTSAVVRIASKDNLAAQAIAAAPGASAALAPGERAVGVPNPASGNPPAFARFVFGEPGAVGDDAFADAGDVVEVGPAGALYDRLSTGVVASSPGQSLAATDFPVVPGVATQLEPSLVTSGGALANDAPARWCVPVFRGQTPGEVNRSCTAFLISEALIDFNSIETGVDTNNVFVEIGGPAGGSLAGLALTDVRGSDGVVATSVNLSNTRMPLDGLWVVARGTSGLTNVANADQITTFDPRNTDGALQLVRTTPTVELLDVLAHGTISVAVDTTRQLSLVASDPLPDLNTRRFSVNWARSDDLAFTGENRVDFRYDPSPTPGARNGVDEFALQVLSPDNAVATATVGLSFEGTDFTDFMTLELGSVTRAIDGTNSGCTFLTQTRFTCNFARPNPQAAARVDVRLTRRPEAPGSITRANGFTWTLPSNETNAPEEANYCNLQYPPATSTPVGVASEAIYGRIYHAGVTEAPGASAGVIAELGFGPLGTDPRSNNSWVWRPAAYNVQVGNDDEYMGTITPPRAGSFGYTFRFSLDGGLTHTYADLDGAGSNGGLEFSAAQLGTLTAP